MDKRKRRSQEVFCFFSTYFGFAQRQSGNQDTLRLGFWNQLSLIGPPWSRVVCHITCKYQHHVNTVFIVLPWK